MSLLRSWFLKKFPTFCGKRIIISCSQGPVFSPCPCWIHIILLHLNEFYYKCPDIKKFNDSQVTCMPLRWNQTFLACDWKIAWESRVVLGIGGGRDVGDGLPNGPKSRQIFVCVSTFGRHLILLLLLLLLLYARGLFSGVIRSSCTSTFYLQECQPW